MFWRVRQSCPVEATVAPRRESHSSVSPAGRVSLLIPILALHLKAGCHPLTETKRADANQGLLSTLSTCETPWVLRPPGPATQLSKLVTDGLYLVRCVTTGQPRPEIHLSRANDLMTHKSTCILEKGEKRNERNEPWSDNIVINASDDEMLPEACWLEGTSVRRRLLGPQQLTFMSSLLKPSSCVL